MRSMDQGARVIAVAGALTIAALACPVTARADCQFEIRATNDMSKDAWVFLYDATVIRMNALGARRVQLKIQNQRIAPGQRMNRRYTASGPCPALRHWMVPQSHREQPGCIFVRTEGTSSTSRTVDLGRVSQWSGSAPPCTEHR